MLSSLELTNLFFHDLRQYNSTNFRTIAKADLKEDDAKVHKAFSSVVTRYFIFAERHPEITDQEKRILYFKLKIDMIASYFSEYPDSDIDLLKAFQLEVKRYLRTQKGDDDLDEGTTKIPDIGLASASSM